MKSCSRYLDFVESAEFSCESPQWQDILAHASKCPDCSTSMHLRGEMLEGLIEFPEPEYPIDLHERIINEIEAEVSSNPKISDWYSSFFESLLTPLKLGFTLACIMMIFFLADIESQPQRQFSKVAVVKPFKIADKRIPEKKAVPEGLESMTSAEVQEFLAKLERFNRNKPHLAGGAEQNDYMPELRLVNDW